MGMVITTSKEVNGDWIFDPQVEDGDALMISGTASTICSVLEAVGLESNGEPDPVWALIGVKPALVEAIEQAREEDPEDDFLLPRLEALGRVIDAGEERGALFLVAS